MEELLFRPGPIVWVQELFGAGHPEPFRVLTQLGTLTAGAGVLWALLGAPALFRLLGIDARRTEPTVQTASTRT